MLSAKWTGGGGWRAGGWRTPPLPTPPPRSTAAPLPPLCGFLCAQIKELDAGFLEGILAFTQVFAVGHHPMKAFHFLHERVGVAMDAHVNLRTTDVQKWVGSTRAGNYTAPL